MRCRTNNDFDFNLDPLVDAVFLLMAFFLFTFEVYRNESVIPASVSAEFAEGESQPRRDIDVFLRSGDAGDLAVIEFAEVSVSDLAELGNVLRNSPSDGDKLAILFPDKVLSYQYVIETIRVFSSLGWSVRLGPATASSKGLQQ